MQILFFQWRGGTAWKVTAWVPFPFLHRTNFCKFGYFIVSFLFLSSLDVCSILHTLPCLTGRLVSATATIGWQCLQMAVQLQNVKYMAKVWKVDWQVVVSNSNDRLTMFACWLFLVERAPVIGSCHHIWPNYCFASTFSRFTFVLSRFADAGRGGVILKENDFCVAVVHLHSRGCWLLWFGVYNHRNLWLGSRRCSNIIEG